MFSPLLPWVHWRRKRKKHILFVSCFFCEAQNTQPTDVAEAVPRFAGSERAVFPVGREKGNSQALQLEAINNFAPFHEDGNKVYSPPDPAFSGRGFSRLLAPVGWGCQGAVWRSQQCRFLRGRVRLGGSLNMPGQEGSSEWMETNKLDGWEDRASWQGRDAGRNDPPPRWIMAFLRNLDLELTDEIKVLWSVIESLSQVFSRWAVF